MIYRLEKPSSEHGTPTFPHRVRPISSRRVRAAPICQKATPRKSPRKKKNATDQSIGVGRRVGGPVQKIWKVKGDAANAAEIKISDSLCKLDLKSNHI